MPTSVFGIDVSKHEGSIDGESVTSRRVDVGIAPTNRWAAACCLTSLALPRQCTI